MTTKALICGSLAYDSIMVFEDHFKNHILPDKVHMLNVSFLVPHFNRDFGGCAGNIGYNFKLLGEEPLIVAAVGRDFEPYRQRLDRLGISRRYVRELEDCYTAQAFITTDLDDNQITAFHPGAMMRSHEIQVKDAEAVDIAIVAPDGRDAMLQHAEQFAERGTPFIFDPGQAMPLFDGKDLKRFIELANYVVVNDYESELVRERTGYAHHDIARRTDAFIVTRGGEGSTVHTLNEVIEIPAAKAEAVADPTGCGDAYRAGLLYGIGRELDWRTTGRIASLLGALKVAQKGPQNHEITLDEFAAKFEEEFGLAMQ
ncbi:MAG: carbohydrate kinase family protein [Pseudomonadota bacterium]